MSNDDEPAMDVIFSLRDDAVWASWPSRDGSVRLGSYDTVIDMMRDFLAQCELGERMALRKVGNF